MDKMKKRSIGKLRRIVQFVWTALSNGYLKGFREGRIYQGNLKNLCVPGLNCYSCMGALGSCPIGALQAELGIRHGKFPFYVFGILVFFGSILGRMVCGFLCPFGLFQDLLYKIPTHKIRKLPGEKFLIKIKYLVFLVFVILLPALFINGDPYFCKYICPQGILEGGIPLSLVNPGIRSALGWLFKWKLMILILVIIMSIFIYRPFCKYLCPLGAFYSLFNKISLYRYKVDKKTCIDCGLCKKKCPMNEDPSRDPNGMECIRCGKCIDICPVDAIERIFIKNGEKDEKKNN